MKKIPLITLALVASCGGQLYCTLIGCDNGLIITFATAATAAYHVDVRDASTNTTFAIDCPDITRCSPNRGFASIAPATAIITITYMGRSSATQIQPDYKTLYPNGEQCGSGCRQATVSLTLP